MEKELRIRNFIYNGFMVQTLEGYASYTGIFIRWTADPGIAEIRCSDGEMRCVPSCRIEGEIPSEPNYNELRAKGEPVLLFGNPSHS